MSGYRLLPASCTSAVLIVALGFSWALSFPLNTIALVSFSPSAIVAWRMLAATLFLLACLPFFPQARQWHIYRQHWRSLIVLGLLGNSVPFVLITIGQQAIPSSHAALLISCVPLMTTIAAPFFFTDEPIRVSKILGIIAGLRGVVILLWPQLTDSSPQTGVLFAYALLITAGVSYTATNIFARTRDTIPLLPRAIGMTLSATIASMLFTITQNGFAVQPPISQPAIIAILTQGLICSACASLLFFALLRVGGSVIAAFASYLVPVFGLLLGSLILDEPLTWRMIVSLSCILCGMMLVTRTTVQALYLQRNKP